MSGVVILRCGEKCFIVKMELKGEEHTQPVNARTPAEARKFFRREHGSKPEIISVRKKDNHFK